MRKFKVKNRQKRKYTRHNLPQSSYQFSPLFAGLLPMIILAIAFAAMYVMNVNVREPTSVPMPQPQLTLPTITPPSFSLNGILQTINSLPILFTQIAAFVIGFADFVATSVQNILTSFVLGLEQVITVLDPRPMLAAIAHVSTNVATSIAAVSVSIAEGIVRIFEMLSGSIAFVGMQLGTGILIIWNTIVSMVLNALAVIGGVLWFVLNGFVQIVLFLFNGLIGILTIIADAIMSFLNKIVNLILVPFQILGAFWMQIKPYADTLLYYCGRAFNDMGKGFENLAKIGALL